MPFPTRLTLPATRIPAAPGRSQEDRQAGQAEQPCGRRGHGTDGPQREGEGVSLLDGIGGEQERVVDRREPDVGDRYPGGPGLHLVLERQRRSRWYRSQLEMPLEERKLDGGRTSEINTRTAGVRHGRVLEWCQ